MADHAEHRFEADPEERLVEGWEPDVPSADSLLLAAVRNHAAHVAAHGAAMGWPGGEEQGLVAAASGLPHPFANFAVLTAPATSSAGQAGLRAARRLAGEVGAPLLILSAWPTPDLGSEGMAPVGHPPLMVRFPGGEGPPQPEGIVIEEVTDASAVATFERTLIDAYPVPELADMTPGSFFGSAVLGTGWRLFAAREGEEVVGTAASFVSDGIQVIEMVSTRGTHRGRGVGAALTWAASTVAPDLPAMLIASDDGQSVYRRLGYLTLSRFTLWVAPPG
jgi:hypothetical protein